MEPARVMVVEDEFIVARDLRLQLEGLGHEVTSLRASGEEALQALEEEAPDLVLMDIVLSGEMDGVETARRMREARPVPLIFLTAYADEETTGRAKITQPFGYLLKPFDPRELRVAIEVALYKARMDQALRESEERYRSLVDNAGQGILVMQDGRARLHNPKLEEMTGLDSGELAGEGLWEHIHPDDRQAAWECYRGWVEGDGRSAPTCFRLTTPQGQTRWLEGNTVGIAWEGRPAALTFLTDITRRRQMRQQMLRSQKMQSLGAVASGMAHDYNNILMGILGGCELAMDESPEGGPVRRDLERIYDLAQRAAGLTRRMLEYTGQSWVDPRSVDLAALVREVEPLLRAALPDRADLKLEAPAGLPAVQGEPSQLQQVVLNLVTNAGEALPEDQPGRVRVSVGVAGLDQPRLAATYLYEEQPPGDYLWLEVADTGAGIPADSRERLFDPFFTTKFLGRGLGLAAVLGIVRGMNGAVEVESQPGEGSVFRLFFPLAGGGEGAGA
jgi:PAS domain S-box-containing protein